MADKTFMSAAVQATIANNTVKTPFNSGVTGVVQSVQNQFSAETARLARSGSLAVRPALDQTSAETNRLTQYSHQTNNTVVTTEPDPVINLKFFPNILDNYDAYTYHAKFFLTTQEASSTGAVLNVANQTIIAETGVSDLTIDNIEIRTVATPSVETGTGIGTTVSFEIIEPSGAGLIDKIFAQSIALGIGNWSVAPFYLQISFRSRDPESSASVDDLTGSLNNLNWLYPLKMGDIKAHVTTVGTRYNCTAVIYNEVAMGNVYNSMQQPVKLENLYDFQSAMAQLENQLNTDQLYKLISTNSIPDSYKIHVDPKIAGYLITPANGNINSARNNNYTQFAGKDAIFAAGTSIDKIIDALLANTKEFQTSLVGSNVAGQEGSPTNETSQMKKFWRIYSETRPLKYDPRRTDNAKEFTFYIYEYDIGILDQNSTQVDSGPSTRASLRRRLATYLNKGLLKKKYNYIFTGLNDQIINFELDMNCAFAVMKARLGGIYSNSASADKGTVNQNNSADEANVEKKLTSTIAFLNNPTNTNAKQRNDAVKDMTNSINAAELSPDAKARNLSILNSAKSVDKFTSLRDIQNTSGVTSGSIDDETAIAQANARSLATPISGAGANVPGSFISDVDLNSAKKNKEINQFIDYNKGKLRPTVFVEGMQDKAASSGVESNSDSGIQKLSSMFSVALHGQYGGSLQAIKMTIKGDPFWLFPYPVSGTNKQIFNSLKPIDDAWEWIKQSKRDKNQANQLSTDNFFVLRFRTPRYYDTGLNDDNDTNVESDTFSGIYKVTTVTNRFHNGKFQQDMAAILDPQLRLSDFKQELDENSRHQEVPTQPDDLLGNAVPATAIKSQTILGSATTTKIPGVDQTVTKIPGVDTTFSRVTTAVDGTVRTVTDSIKTGANTIRSNIPGPLATLAGLPPKFG